MKTYKATVYTLTAAYGNEGIVMRVVERDASNVDDFKAVVRDEFTRDVDDEVDFGPVSEVRR